MLHRASWEIADRMKMEKVRIGVVGIGHLGQFHLQKYAKLENCEIVGASDVLEERAEDAAALHGCQAMTDYRKMIGSVDAVSIAVPTQCHHTVAKAFLEAGVHVLLEKPIAETLAQADELIALADKSRLVFQIGFVERFNPAVVALREVIGRPLFIESHRLHPFFERGTDVDVILDLMVHDLDIILHFVNSPLQDVDAVGTAVLSDKVDIANARLRFQNGCAANITASRISIKTMQKVRFFGLEGYHAVDFVKRDLLSLQRLKGPQGQIEIVQNHVEIIQKDPLEEEIRSFIDAVVQGTPSVVPGREGRRALDVALRILDEIKKAQDKVL
jgi:predicted dehydrogenase